ncbi:uncharacterized protein LOC123306345 [Coccinella septempunctata]|uniref:uncharacterized protein LOC123306345 n=1 Tax=Coccinella septempunctata TaxID=41139 RepID=UPI001D08BA8A|nr:uncharacterized protein LOC123306345 [Coccinella septempunctata]
MPCKLKRNHLINYEIAEEELDRMSDQEETEQEESFLEKVQIRKRSRVPVSSRTDQDQNNNYNSLAKVCLEANKIVDTSAYENEANHSQIYTVDLINSTDATESIIVDLPNQGGVSQLDDSKLDAILSNQALILEQIQKNETNCLTIFEKLATLEATLDHIWEKQKSCICKNEVDSIPLISDGTEFIQQIDCLEDLKKLDEKLSDNIEMRRYIEKLSFICGRRGNGNGLDNCYLLVDKLFTRKFMTLCSWAGGSRDKEKEKIPFKTFKNVINVFFKIIHLSDNDFSLRECEDFLKNVIRHSSRRNSTAPTRCSRQKRRQKSMQKIHQVADGHDDIDAQEKENI